VTTERVLVGGRASLGLLVRSYGRLGRRVRSLRPVGIMDNPFRAGEHLWFVDAELASR